VWVLTRSLDRFRAKLPHLAGHPAVHLVEGRAEDFQFPQERMDFVIHSMVPDPGMSLEDMEKWFEKGTRRLLELAARDRSEGFLLCSTGAVYQPQGRPLSEEDPLVPLDGPLTYGRIRRQVEEQCIEASKKHAIPLKIARGFSFAGPRLPGNVGFALSDFLRDAAAGIKIRVHGTGLPVRSYMHGRDMALWLWKFLLRTRKANIFNVGSPEGIRLLDLAQTIADLAENEIEVLQRPGTGAAGNSHYVPLTTKAMKELENAAPRNLKDILVAETQAQAKPCR
jgi:dTDP-glucose 4,6-dehydratase